MATIITTTILNPDTTITNTAIPIIGQAGDADFDRTFGNIHSPVLLAFVSEDCPVCQRLLAQLRHLMASGEKQFNLASVLLSASPALAGRFGVWSAPALLLVQNGNCVWKFVGEPSRRELADLLARARRMTFAA